MPLTIETSKELEQSTQKEWHTMRLLILLAKLAAFGSVQRTKRISAGTFPTTAVARQYSLINASILPTYHCRGSSKFALFVQNRLIAQIVTVRRCQRQKFGHKICCSWKAMNAPSSLWPNVTGTKCAVGTILASGNFG